MEPKEIQQLAANANAEVWNLLAQPKLTDEEKDKMVSAAYASLYLWENGGGTIINTARGHWLISRVMCVLGEATLARHHAEFCSRRTALAEDRKDFDVAYAIEAEARSAALLGERKTAESLREQAMELARTVKDEEDRQLVISDIASPPWFGLPAL